MCVFKQSLKDVLNSNSFKQIFVQARADDNKYAY